MNNQTNDPISEILYPIYNYGWPGTGMPNTQRQMTYKEAHRAISNLLEQETLKARIDELENRLRVQFVPSHWERLCSEVNSWAKYVDRRIGDLKAQLTINKSKE